MANTPMWSLPHITAGDVSAEVQYNENLRWLEAIATAVVINETATPPGSPNEGDMHIVDDSATGAWSGYDRKLALWVNGAWQFREAPEGYAVYELAGGAPLRFLSGSWT